MVIPKGFYEVFRTYGDNRFGQHTRFTTTMGLCEGAFGYSVVEVRGDQTEWILVSDPAFAESLLQAVPFPTEQRSP